MSLKYYFIQFWADWERNRLESENKNPFSGFKKTNYATTSHRK